MADTKLDKYIARRGGIDVIKSETDKNFTEQVEKKEEPIEHTFMADMQWDELIARAKASLFNQHVVNASMIVVKKNGKITVQIEDLMDDGTPSVFQTVIKGNSEA